MRCISLLLRLLLFLATTFTDAQLPSTTLNNKTALSYKSDHRNNKKDFSQDGSYSDRTGEAVSIDESNKRFAVSMPGFGDNNGTVSFGEVN